MMQVNLRINVFIWASDKEILIFLKNTLNVRNPPWNIKCASYQLIIALEKQLRFKYLTPYNKYKSCVR